MDFKVLGHSDLGLLYLNKSSEIGLKQFNKKKSWSLGHVSEYLKHVGCDNKSEVTQASVYRLNKDDHSFQCLLGIVFKLRDLFASWLFSIECSKQRFEIAGAIPIESKEKEVRIHFVPRCSKDNSEGESSRVSFVLLTLDEGITLYNVKISDTNLQITHSEVVVSKPFWWSQWLPDQEAVAFAHFRKNSKHSAYYDEDEEQETKPRPLLSILQFHKDYPRESVLNMPLDSTFLVDDSTKCLHDDPHILTSSQVQMKLLAHSSGAVVIFHLSEKTSQGLKYSLHLLHHNKKLDVEVCLKGSTDNLRVGVGFYDRGCYIIIAGHPHFIHLFDVGALHEPSHHLIFEWTEIFPSSTPLLNCIYNTNVINGKRKKLNCKEDNDNRPNSHTFFVYEDASIELLELNSALLLPLMMEKKMDIYFKLAVLHYFIVHLGDINVAKRIIYDEGKQRGNLFLKHVYQEFLIGHAHLQTKKQILPNMDSFLYLIPYTAGGGIECPDIKLDLSSQPTDACTILLSPSQRVFPHNVTDVWTCLWQLSRNYTKSKRFSHKDVAEKLMLSLQCYKPEALSRASTPGPMSPSSPLVCSSFSDIATSFGRRATELQLPFVEHESCTANKQEYVFSINLREMSMHLLKERKEWPLHGHTIAGKYVCALGDTARLLCHLLCLTAHLQPTKHKDKGFPLIDTLDCDLRLKLFMLMEHYTLALTTLACPLPQGFTPFFCYLGYRVLQYPQFLWHVKVGTFDLHIDLVKTIMTDMTDSTEGNVEKKLQLLSLLPKTRAYRILNTWTHKTSITLRARQHASDLLSGSASQHRRRMMTAVGDKTKGDQVTPLDTFFQLLTAKANASEIDLELLTQATLISMEDNQ